MRQLFMIIILMMFMAAPAGAQSYWASANSRTFWYGNYNGHRDAAHTWRGTGDTVSIIWKVSTVNAVFVEGQVLKTSSNAFIRGSVKMFGCVDTARVGGVGIGAVDSNNNRWHTIRGYTTGCPTCIDSTASVTNSSHIYNFKSNGPILDNYIMMRFISDTAKDTATITGRVWGGNY